MATGKANGGERNAALAGRVMECMWIGLVVARAEEQPTVTMRLAEAEWYVARQEVLPRFAAVGNCRVRAIDVLPETLVQRLWAMHQAQDNTHLQELVNTALAASFTLEA